MLYVTYNDAPSGIYYSQVSDVCSFISSRFNIRVKLLALVSLRNFFSSRKKIKSSYPHSIVLPMFPRAGNWKKNSTLIRVVNFFLREKRVIARGPFAASMCIDLREKGVFDRVCFDARGSYAAELNEYDVVNDERVKKTIADVEKKAVMQSDFHLAVSHALLAYWNKQFAYTGANHVVIPCTLNSAYAGADAGSEKIAAARKKFEIHESEILICYSGSLAGWQSFSLLDKFFVSLLGQNSMAKILFLSPSLPSDMQCIKKFPGRIIHSWLPPGDVLPVLSACDYGMLVREQSLTNRVASPVKFAEYLAAGMKIIISENLGDYSGFVRKHNCGIVVDPESVVILDKPPAEEKKNMKQLAGKYFLKENYIDQYRKLLA